MWDIHDEMCGARVTCNYVRIGGISADVVPEFKAFVEKLAQIAKLRKDFEDLLLSNPIFIERMENTGLLAKRKADRARDRPAACRRRSVRDAPRPAVPTQDRLGRADRRPRRQHGPLPDPHQRTPARARGSSSGALSSCPTGRSISTTRTVLARGQDGAAIYK